MTAGEGIGKAGEAARAARRNRYVRRLIEDEDVRRNLLAAYGTARSVYARMGNGKPVSKAILEDRKLRREVAEAVKAISEASRSITEPPRSARKRKRGAGRMLLLLVVGGVLALVLSESVRSKVLDLIFGSEEEFEYSSTTAPAEPAPTASASASAS